MSQLESQEAISIVALDHIDATRVRTGHEAALLQDDAEQLVDVAFRRHGARDVYEFPKLELIARYPLAASLRAPLCIEQLESALAGDVKLVGGRIGRQESAKTA